EEIAITHIQAGPYLRKLTMGDLAPPDVGHYRDAVRPSDDPLLGNELIPGWEGKLGFATTTINQHGMRDREGITVRKPADTRRIASTTSHIRMSFTTAANSWLASCTRRSRCRTRSWRRSSGRPASRPKRRRRRWSGCSRLLAAR